MFQILIRFLQQHTIAILAILLVCTTAIALVLWGKVSALTELVNQKQREVRSAQNRLLSAEGLMGVRNTKARDMEKMMLKAIELLVRGWRPTEDGWYARLYEAWELESPTLIKWLLPYLAPPEAPTPQFPERERRSTGSYGELADQSELDDPSTSPGLGPPGPSLILPNRHLAAPRKHIGPDFLLEEDEHLQ